MSGEVLLLGYGLLLVAGLLYFIYKCMEMDQR